MPFAIRAIREMSFRGKEKEMNKCDSVTGCESTDVRLFDTYGYLCQAHMDELRELMLDLDITSLEKSTLMNELTWRPVR